LKKRKKQQIRIEQILEFHLTKAQAYIGKEFQSQEQLIK
jgi:hypothetical protein